jgi:phosphatidylserine/phosphatidylglycerophosphate/cardiolipin synthase-like enzyme
MCIAQWCGKCRLPYIMHRLRKVPLVLVVLVTLILWTGLFPPVTLPQENPTTLEVCFSPNRECTSSIVEELSKAKDSVLVQAYSFTSDRIAEALLNAFNRGVKVEVILDRRGKTEKSSKATVFIDKGIPVMIDDKHAKAHNKVMVIDGETVITGSFNFTEAAEKKNAENLLIIHDRKLAEKYVKNWREHAQHLKLYVGSGVTKAGPAVQKLVQEKDKASDPER